MFGVTGSAGEITVYIDIPGARERDGFHISSLRSLPFFVLGYSVQVYTRVDDSGAIAYCLVACHINWHLASFVLDEARLA